VGDGGRPLVQFWSDRGPARSVYNFYSSSAHSGLSSIQGGPQVPVPEPRGWSSVAIPAEFVPLSDALCQVPNFQQPRISSEQ
jgi:hypothetical protein